MLSTAPPSYGSLSPKATLAFRGSELSKQIMAIISYLELYILKEFISQTAFSKENSFPFPVVFCGVFCVCFFKSSRS